MDDWAVDVVVAGAGPAGALLAPALVRRGLRVLLVDPQGLRPSPKTLCDFQDHLDPMVVGATCARGVLQGAGQRTTLPAYSQIRADRIAAAARACVDVGALQLAHAAVVDVTPEAADGGLTLRLRPSDDARTARGNSADSNVRARAPAWAPSIRARALIDTTGHNSTLVRRPVRRLAWQTAFGLRIRGTDPALQPGEACFMDWTPPPSGLADARADVPSFLYAIPFADGSVLLEETVLAARPAVDIDLLEARLRARLAARGTVVDEVLETERVSIPMDLPLPEAGQLVAAFGAAAGLVHPTTGFQVARAMARVEAVADAIAGAIADGPAATAEAVLQTLWTPEERARRDLHLFCLEAALHLRTADDAGRFFQRFFTLDGALPWLAGTLSAADTRRAMWQLFGEASWSDRALLVRGALSRHALPVLGGLTAAAFAGAHRAPAVPSMSSMSSMSSTSASTTTSSPRPDLSAGVSP